MRKMFFVVLAALALGGCGTVTQGAWVRGASVRFINGSDDADAEVAVAGGRGRFVFRGTTTAVGVPGGPFFAYAYDSVSGEAPVSAKICLPTLWVPRERPPVWATDSRLLGIDLALDENFFRHQWTPLQLEERVERIALHLSSKVVGGAKMKAELLGWFDRAKDEPPTTYCGGNTFISARVQFQQERWASGHVVINAYVCGNRREGYYLANSCGRTF